MTSPTQREKLSRVLLVEDDESQRFTLASILEREGFDVVGCGSGAEAVEHVECESFAVAVVDQRLPDLEGTQVLRRMHEIDDSMHVIMHTAHGSFDSARDSVNYGAFAYVEKAGDPHVLVHHVHRAVRKQMDRYAVDLEATIADRTAALRSANATLRREIADRKLAEDASRKSEARYRELVENANCVILRLDNGGSITFFNEYAQQLFGYTEDEVVGRPILGTIIPVTDSAGHDQATVIEDLRRNPNRHRTTESEALPKEGPPLWMSWTNKAILDETGGTVGLLCIGNDVTEQKRLEDQLRQAQKLQAIGQLAGGVAHDFNNLLMVIAAHVEILRGMAPQDSPVHESLNAMESAVHQATGVSRSLLTFSRNLRAEKRLVNLCAVVRQAGLMLQRTLPAAIELIVEANCKPEPWVTADPVQLQQIILNLAVNARDAMPNGGVLRISVSPPAPAATCRPGATDDRPFACFAIEDTGCGMPPEIQAHIFEPFFTTKPRETGTGLGLAVVHGIVEDCGGRIEVSSRVGEGSKFTVCVPCAPPGVRGDSDHPSTDVPRGEGETILLAEDNQQIRQVLATALESLGYQVLQATDGDELLQSFATYADRIRVFVLDLDLPKRSALQCLREIRARGTATPAIVMTGMLDAEIEAQTDDDTILLHKPFRTAELGRVIHAQLHGSIGI